MDVTTNNEYCTPQKQLPQHQSINFICGNSTMNSPRAHQMRSFCQQNLTGTPSDISSISVSKRRTTGSFHLLPFIHTPSPSRLKKVVNPFEHALTDRLHLPLICSPSLFNVPPATPKNNSLSQFEWTIDDVSSLAPANVEPHVTQFESSPGDPELEAKAQAAIRSYFKEQLIVPSPAECSLRARKTTITEKFLSSTSVAKITSSSPTSSSSSSSIQSKALASLKCKNDKLNRLPLKRNRNVVVQTMLSFPPKLPTEVEIILKKYLILNDNDLLQEIDDDSPQNGCNDDMNDDLSLSSGSSKEVSRRLFDTSMNTRDDPLDDLIKTPTKQCVQLTNELSLSSPIKTPDLQDNQPLTAKNSGSLCNDTSFGAISPISKANSPSSTPLTTRTHCRNNITNYVNVEQTFYTSISNQSIYKSIQDNTTMNMSIDQSLNSSQKLTTNCIKSNKNILNDSQTMNLKSYTEMEDDNMFNQYDYNDDMQISQLSRQSSNSSDSSGPYDQSQHLETPIKKRHPSRKNLSQSFSCYFNDDTDDDDNDNKNECKNVLNDKENYLPTDISDISIKKTYDISNRFIKSIQTSPKIPKLCNARQLISSSSPSSSSLLLADSEKTSSSVFYRIDSGFNELTSTQDESKFNADLKLRCGLEAKNCHCRDTTVSNIDIPFNDCADVSMTEHKSSLMRCCSTPSKIK